MDHRVAVLVRWYHDWEEGLVAAGSLSWRVNVPAADLMEAGRRRPEGSSFYRTIQEEAQGAAGRTEAALHDSVVDF